MSLFLLFVWIALLISFEIVDKLEHSDFTSTEDVQFVHIKKQESANEHIKENSGGTAQNKQKTRNGLKKDETICEDAEGMKTILKESKKDSKEKRSEPNDMNCHLKNEKSQLKIVGDSKRVFHNQRSTVMTVVYFGNSSCEMKYLSFVKEERRSLMLINDLSAVLIHCCSVHQRGASRDYLFTLNEGHLILSHTSYSSAECAEICQSFVGCEKISSEFKKKDLKIIDSAFSSFSLGRSTSFLVSTNIREIVVYTCHFSNISQSARIQNNHYSMGNSKNDYSFTGCVVEKVDSPLGGGLVEGMRSGYHHFLACNSSYSQCIRRENTDPVIGNKTMKSQVIDSGDATFVDCDFNNLSTENSSRVNGGAILFTSSGLLNVTLCKFHSCHSSYCGGAISSGENGKNFIIASSVFDSCTGEASGGCLYFYFISTFSVKNINCSYSSVKHMGGGIFIEHNEHQGLAENCHFYNCRKNTTQYNGGGSVGFYNDVSAIFTDCSICGGYSEKNGGGISWDNIPGENDSPTLFCFFSNNIAVNLGHDVYAVEGWTNITENSFVLCSSSTAANRNRVIIGTTEHDSWIPKVFFNPVFVNSQEGLDHMACGFVRAEDGYGRRCKTIEFGMSVLDGDGSSNEVIIEFGDYEENKIDVGKMRIAFEGKDKAQVVVRNRSPNGESLVAIGAGVGSFRNMTFVCGENPSSHLMEVLAEVGMLNMCKCVITSLRNDESCVLTASLMIIQKGSVSFDSVEISGISFSSIPAFNIRGESSLSFQMNNVDAYGISRAGGDGSVICGNLVNGMNVNISGGMMRNCECEDGCGGGMWIQLDEGSKMEIGNVSSEGADENVDCVTFSSCSCVGKGNGVGGYGGAIYLDVVDENCAFCIHCAHFEDCQAENGNNIFVNAQCLRDVVSRITFGFEHEGMTDSDLLGFEDGCREECVPLLPFLMETGDIGFVGGEKSLDFSRCGMEQYPCSSIKRVVELWFGAVPRTIRIKNGFVLCEEIVMESQFWNVTGTIRDTVVEVVVSPALQFDSECLIHISSGALLKDLCFSLPSALSPASSFIFSSSNALSVSDCSIEPAIGNSQNEIEYCVFLIEGGVLHMTGFSNKGSLNTLSDPIIRCCGESSAEFSNCVLTGISRRNGGGSCLERSCDKKKIENSDTSIVDIIIITNSTFSECGAEEKDGCGGGTKISIGKDEEVAINGSTTFDGCNAENEADSNGRGGGVMITVGSGGSLKMKEVKFEGCEVPSGESDEVGRGLGGGMFVELPNQMGSFVLEGMIFEGCNAWKGKNAFVSGWDLSEVVNKENFKWEMSSEELRSFDELCGWERKMTGEEEYVIPLVVYLWRNWSGDGYVSREKGGDFSGCGYSEAPCSSIDHLISLLYPTFGEGETHIAIVGSGLLSHSISFSSSSSSISESPKVVIDGTKKGTGVTISDEDENDLPDDGSMISSNVSLSFVNVSFTKPAITTHHEVLIESSGTNTLLSVSDCSFGPGRGVTESFGYCLMRVNGGSVLIERSSLSLISELKGLIAFSPSASEVTVQNVNISFAGVIERSLISMIDENQMNGDENTGSNGNRPVLRVVGCSFTNITNEGIGASVVDVGSFENGVECMMDECSMSSCKSGLSTEGGGMRVVLKSGESVLKVNGGSFSTCKCSSDTGRGGGLFIDGSDPNANYGNESQIPPLNFKIVNILFVMNEAYVGKDVFVRCHSIEHQINETLFALNYNQESLNSNNSICGRDASSEGGVDLIPLITFYYSAQVFVSGRGSDDRRCGAQTNPCLSINCGVEHIQEGVMNAILIEGEGFVTEECVIGDLVVNSLKKGKAIVKMNSKIEKSFEKDCVMELVNECSVERCSFQFEDGFETTHGCIMKVKNGSMEIQKCEFFSSLSATAVELQLNSSVVSVESGELKISETTFRDIHSKLPVISFCEESDVTIVETRILNIKCEGDVVSVGRKAKVEVKEMEVENVTLLFGGCTIAMEDAEQEESVQNCSFGKCTNSVDKGSMMQIRQSKEVMIEICVFDGETEIEFINEGIERMKEEGLCKWNGSLVDIENSNVEMRETTIMKSKGGGLYVSGGSVKIEKGEFENNNPSIEGYPSARRNMICEGNSELNVVSVKGGDGMFPNTSLWILNDGCELSGIVAERESSFFIPVLHEVKSSPTSSCATNLTLFGELLLPCDLTLKLCFTNGEVDFIELHEINKEGFSSENEIQTVATSSQLENVREETEVSLCVLFGKEDSPSSTQSFILKNRSETKAKGDERIVEGGKEGKSFWPIIVIILSIILIIFIVLFVVVIMLLRKKLRESEKKVEKEILENEQILEKIERRRRENNGGSFEMNEMPSTLLEGMTSQIPLLIDNDEDLPEPPSMIDDVLNENDLPDLESPLPFPENASVSGVLQPHSFNVISAKKPFREKEKKNLKALHSVIHSVEGDFTLGTRAMDVIDGKEVVKAVADLFEHLISVGDERVEMMGRQLCPYTIFIEEGNENEIYLLTEELEDEKEKEEMKRWKAPEVGNEDEEIEKAVVFTLGLILHEMTTGEVPLSECNAEEAQEMMRDGVRPLTEGIEGTEMVEVMEKMWMDDPRGRPALAEVKRQMKVAMRDDA